MHRGIGAVGGVGQQLSPCCSRAALVLDFGRCIIFAVYAGDGIGVGDAYIVSAVVGVAVSIASPDGQSGDGRIGVWKNTNSNSFAGRATSGVGHRGGERQIAGLSRRRRNFIVSRVSLSVKADGVAFYGAAIDPGGSDRHLEGGLALYKGGKLGGEPAGGLGGRDGADYRLDAGRHGQLGRIGFGPDLRARSKGVQGEGHGPGHSVWDLVCQSDGRRPGMGACRHVGQDGPRGAAKGIGQGMGKGVGGRRDRERHCAAERTAGDRHGGHPRDRIQRHRCAHVRGRVSRAGDPSGSRNGHALRPVAVVRHGDGMRPERHPPLGVVQLHSRGECHRGAVDGDRPGAGAPGLILGRLGFI